MVITVLLSGTPQVRLLSWTPVNNAVSLCFQGFTAFFVITDREANVWLLMSVGISKSHLFCKIAC